MLQLLQPYIDYIYDGHLLIQCNILNMVNIFWCNMHGIQRTSGSIIYVSTNHFQMTFTCFRKFRLPTSTMSTKTNNQQNNQIINRYLLRISLFTNVVFSHTQSTTHSSPRILIRELYCKSISTYNFVINYNIHISQKVYSYFIKV